MFIFLKSSYRNFIKHLNLNIINIIGISLGISVVTLCFLLIQYEFSFDKHFKNIDNIYRIVREDLDNLGNRNCSRGTSGLLSSAVNESFPQIEHTARIFNNGVNIHQPGSTDFFNERIAIIDKEFCEIFSVKFIEGNYTNSLDKPFGVILTKKTAERIFNNEDPIGKPVVFQGFYFQDVTMEVTGIIEDFPENSTLQFEMLSTEKSFLMDWLMNTWTPTNGYLPIQTFIQTQSTADNVQILNKLNNLVKDHFTEDLHSKISYHLQPLERAHLYSDADYGFGSVGNINHIYFFITLSVLIMLIVIINFLNVSNTLFHSRMIGTGIKKVFGCSRFVFLLNFFFETFFLIIICMPLTLLIVYLAIPLVNQSINSEINLSLFNNSSVLFRYFGLILFIVLFVGAIPSFKISSVKPVKIFTGKVKSEKKVFSHTTFIAIQFCIVIILIISTFHIRKQLNFMIEKDLGFNKENVMLTTILANDPALRNRCEEVKTEFLNHPDIISATASHAIIGVFAERHSIKPEGHEELDMLGIGVDADYIPFYDIKLLEGRNFRANSRSDLTSVILNKKAVNILNWKEPIGRTFDFRGAHGQVIGVVDNFHINNLNEEIKPAYLQMELPKNILALKFKGDNIQEIKKFVENKCSELSPNNIPQTFSLSDALESQYNQEQTSIRIFGIFSILAIVLSCIGLLGIVVEYCQNRIKETAIRKINGAKIIEVMLLLNNDFLKSIIIAFLLAIPISWFGVERWLQGFAYKINISWWIFVYAGLLALIISVITVSWKSWIAARRNPVEALRYE